MGLDLYAFPEFCEKHRERVSFDSIRECEDIELLQVFYDHVHDTERSAQVSVRAALASKDDDAERLGRIRSYVNFLNDVRQRIGKRLEELGENPRHEYAHVDDEYRRFQELVRKRLGEDEFYKLYWRAQQVPKEE